MTARRVAHSDTPKVADSAKTSRVTMYYDGDCTLCAREVAHYRRLDAARRVHWVDIQTDSSVLEQEGIAYEQAMARLHVRNPQGKIITGAWAFAALWEQLPYYNRLARTIRALHLMPVMDAAYTRFARWRLRRRSCSSGSCNKINSIGAGEWHEEYHGDKTQTPRPAGMVQTGSSMQR